jgi:hypothetical protein
LVFQGCTKEGLVGPSTVPPDERQGAQVLVAGGPTKWSVLSISFGPMISKIFSAIFLVKNGGFFCSNYCCFFCKIFIITLFFEKNVNLFAENWQKSQKM